MIQHLVAWARRGESAERFFAIEMPLPDDRREDMADVQARGE